MTQLSVEIDPLPPGTPFIRGKIKLGPFAGEKGIGTVEEAVSKTVGTCAVCPSGDTDFSIHYRTSGGNGPGFACGAFDNSTLRALIEKGAAEVGFEIDPEVRTTGLTGDPRCGLPVAEIVRRVRDREPILLELP